MGYIIGMISQKGGVGKSTLARMMAREFAEGGMSVKIADLDTQQQTCTYWAGRRAENGVTPEIQVQGFASVKSAIEDAARFDAYILDGKPNASEQHSRLPRYAIWSSSRLGRRSMICIPAWSSRTRWSKRVYRCTKLPLLCSRRRGASAKTTRPASISNRRDI